MAQYYYFLSQLPSLDALGDASPLPITWERFRSLAEEFLSPHAKKALEEISLSPPRKANKALSPILNAFWEKERELRLYLASLRGEKMNKAVEIPPSLSQDVMQAAKAAMEAENPLEAERILFLFRTDALEALRPADPFSEDFAFYYAIRLRLLSRFRKFDRDAGRKAYENIYETLVKQEHREAEK